MSDEIESDFESYFKKSNRGISSNGEPLITSESVKDSWFGGTPWTVHVHLLVASLHTDFSWLFKLLCQLCLTLCDPMYCSTPGFPVLHHVPEFAQTHVHWIGDVIQPSHPLSPLLLLPSVFLNIRVFSSELTLLIRWPKYWSFSFSISPFNEYSELISLRIDWLGLLAVQGTLKSLLQHHSSLADIM